MINDFFGDIWLFILLIYFEIRPFLSQEEPINILFLYHKTILYVATACRQECCISEAPMGDKVRVWERVGGCNCKIKLAGTGTCSICAFEALICFRSHPIYLESWTFPLLWAAFSWPIYYWSVFTLPYCFLRSFY